MTTEAQTRSPRSLRFLLAIAAGSFISAQANAALLTPGAPAITTPGNATFAGLTQVDLPNSSTPADESFTVTAYDTSSVARYTATVESKVLEAPGGTLDFAYQITNLLSGEPDSIQTVSMDSFRNFTTDADYVAASGAVTYADIGRNAILGGFSITMDYSPSANSIAPGEATDWVLIKTNATNFDNAGLVNLLSGAPASVEAFEPAAAVPEPVTSSLVFLACAGVIGRRPNRRPNRRQKNDATLLD